MRKVKGLFVLLAVVFLVTCTVYYKQYNLQESAVSQENERFEEIQTLKIAYLPITHALPLFKTKEVIEAQGDVKVELIRYGGWSELMDALNTGRVDGASLLIEMAMKSKEQGIPLELIALGHRDGNVIITSEKINVPEDFVGKTFAIPNEQSTHNILLQEFLKNNGMDVSQVKIIEMAPAEMPAALQSGQIQGYCVAEPFGAKAVAANIGKVYTTSESLWKDSICCGIVMNRSAIKDKKQIVNLFKKTFEKVGDDLTKEEAETIAEKYLEQPREIGRISLQWISFDHLSVTKEAYLTLTDKIKSFGLSDNPPSYEEFVLD